VKQELIGSTIVHLGLALFLILVTMPGSLPPPVLNDDVMLVTPVEALPSGMLAVPQTEVPQAAVDESPAGEVAIPVPKPEAVPIKPKVPDKPKPKPVTKKPEVQSPPKQAAATEAATKTPADAGASDVIESRVQAGAGTQSQGSLLGIPGGTAGGRPAGYPDRVTSKVYYMWRNPVKTPDPANCSVVFRIDADGHASQIALERSSGLPAFDNATLRAVYEAAPYPPFPRSMDQAYIVMRIIFEYLP